MTQTIPKLILTRPKAQSLETLQVLSQVVGREPDHIVDPLIEIVQVSTELPSAFDVPIIFTSRHAVEITAKITMARGVCLCVGERVAEMANKCGFSVSECFDTVGDLIDFGLPERAVYLRGEQVSCDLSKHCNSLQEFILYKQSPRGPQSATIQAINEGGLIPVFSENGAKQLIQAIGLTGSQAILVCISEKVANWFDSKKFNKVVVSLAPTRQAMIEKLAEYL